MSGPTLADEVAFISGVDSTGKTAATSFDTWNDGSPAAYGSTSYAHKWNGGAAGTAGGTVRYYFDPASNWTATEKQGFIEGLALWSDVANINFVATTNASAAELTFTRGDDGSAYEYDNAGGEAVGGSTLAGPTSSTISMDTSIYGWQKPGSFTDAGGYDMDTIVHEEGHVLGLGHAGPYNGNVTSSTQQYSAYDTRQWSLMSYIEPQDTTAKYYSSSTVTGTKWAYHDPTTWMPLDILAAQRLYGMPVNSPLSGGQTFGFNCNVAGASESFFDFTVNTTPVITLWDEGTGNTLDLSGFAQSANINLNPGTFSSCDGLVNNIGIAFATKIDSVVLGGSGNTLTSNSDGDTYKTSLADLANSVFTNLAAADTIWITNATPGAFAASYSAGTITYSNDGRTSYTATLQGAPSGSLTEAADASGTGVDLHFAPSVSVVAPTVAITSAGGATNQAAQVVSGTVDLADVGTTVTIYDNGSSTALASVVVGSNGTIGTWSASVILKGAGTHSLVAKDTNGIGTGVSAARLYTLDTTAPVVSITSKGATTSNTHQTITGKVDTADAGSTVTLFDGASALNTATVASNGNWSMAVTLSGNGKHTLVARDTDLAGNIGSSAAVIYTLDTIGPTVAITTAGGAVTKAAQSIKGTVDVADAGTKVSLYDNGGTTAIGTATVSGTGAWSMNVTLKGNGTNVLVAKDIDAVGNIGVSNSISFNLAASSGHSGTKSEVLGQGDVDSFVYKSHIEGHAVFGHVAGGADHNVSPVLASDFRDLGQLLRHTTMSDGNAEIHTPGQTFIVDGVTRADIAKHLQDFRFHG